MSYLNTPLSKLFAEYKEAWNLFCYESVSGYTDLGRMIEQYKKLCELDREITKRLKELDECTNAKS